jgi:hypothetical protein
MPAKKGGKKKKKITLPEKEIKPMPALVFNNIRVTKNLPDENLEKEKTKSETTKEINSISTTNIQAVSTTNKLKDKFIAEQLSRRNKLTYWLYIGMAIMVTAIAIFWGFSLWSNITSINWQKSKEKQVIEKSTSDLNEIFSTPAQNQLQNQLTKLQIKELISKQLNQNKNLIFNPPTSSLVNTTTTVTTTKN